MLKGIRLQFEGAVDPASAASGEVEKKLRDVFAGADLTLDVEELHVDDAGKVSGAIYISGEQEAGVDFKALTTRALASALEQLRGPGDLQPAPMGLDEAASAAPRVREVHNEDEDEGVIEPPPLPGAPSAPSPPPPGPRPRPRKRLFEEPEDTPAPQAPKAEALEDCPLGGDGGDHQLNELKNRTNSGNWREVSIQDLLDLDWPEGIERRDRANWPTEAMKEVRANEKQGAMEITGWLASIKREGEESCNCHSPVDVDYHLWIVDDPSKASKDNRWQSVVCEVGPRVRAMHTGWDSSRIAKVVHKRMEVRLTGWLMMDQEHPEQLQKTRGTLWEMHPIIEFYVRQNGDWVSLDDAEL